jgi:hypothetical protein
VIIALSRQFQKTLISAVDNLLRYQQLSNAQNLLGPSLFFWARPLPTLGIGEAKMKRILPALFIFAALLPLPSEGRSEPLRIAENLRNETILMPQGAPDRGQLVLTDYRMVEEERGGVGIMIFYDDPRTKLELDYIELYDVGGDLLLVSWIDRFGVCQVAIDRALLDRKRSPLTGCWF